MSKEKKLSEKDLVLENAGRGIWLVKVPKYLDDKWKSTEGPAIVGKLKISRKMGAKPNVSFTSDDKMTLGEDGVPREHKFVMNTIIGHHLACFSHTSGDPTINPPILDVNALEGKVVQRAECRPIQDSVYNKIKKKAYVEATTPLKTTIKLDHFVNTYKPKANHAGNLAYEKSKKGEGKMTRDDKDRVMNLLFSLFEKHQYYNIRDLVKSTRQPVTYLKEILNEVCNYNVKSPHKNMWELKPEYRHYKAPEDEEKKEEMDSSDEDDD